MKYNEEHDGRLENYTLSQVAEIARLEISLFCDVIDRGEITESMSCASIREVVNKYKTQEEPNEPDDVSDDVAGETTPDDNEDNDDLVVTYKGFPLPLTAKHLKELDKWLTKREYL